jgi:TRAP-type C4-dicarboxylate transport system permease small subunit
LAGAIAQEDAMLRFLFKLDRWIERILRWFSIGCLVMLAVVLSAVVFVRFFPIAKLSWSDEAVEWAFAWLVFMGAAALWRRNEHFCVDALSCKLGQMRSGLFHSLVVGLLSLCFFVIFTYYGFLLTAAANDRSPILEWPRPIWYASMPIAGVIMTGYCVQSVIKIILEIVTPKKARQKPMPD